MNSFKDFKIQLEEESDFFIPNVLKGNLTNVTTMVLTSDNY